MGMSVCGVCSCACLCVCMFVCVPARGVCLCLSVCVHERARRVTERQSEAVRE